MCVWVSSFMTNSCNALFGWQKFFVITQNFTQAHNDRTRHVCWQMHLYLWGTLYFFCCCWYKQALSFCYLQTHTCIHSGDERPRGKWAEARRAKDVNEGETLFLVCWNFLRPILRRAKQKWLMVAAEYSSRHMNDTIKCSTLLRITTTLTRTLVHTHTHICNVIRTKQIFSHLQYVENDSKTNMRANYRKSLSLLQYSTYTQDIQYYMASTSDTENGEQSRHHQQHIKKKKKKKAAATRAASRSDTNDIGCAVNVNEMYSRWFWRVRT